MNSLLACFSALLYIYMFHAIYFYLKICDCIVSTISKPPPHPHSCYSFLSQPPSLCFLLIWLSPLILPPPLSYLHMKSQKIMCLFYLYNLLLTCTFKEKQNQEAFLTGSMTWESNALSWMTKTEFNYALLVQCYSCSYFIRSTASIVSHPRTEPNCTLTTLISKPSYLVAITVTSVT